MAKASLVAQTVKHLIAVQETRVRFLGQEDPLVKEMATHTSTLAWKTPWTEEPGRLQSMGLQRVGHNRATSLYFEAEECRKESLSFLPLESPDPSPLFGTLNFLST